MQRSLCHLTPLPWKPSGLGKIHWSNSARLRLADCGAGPQLAASNDPATTDANWPAKIGIQHAAYRRRRLAPCWTPSGFKIGRQRRDETLPARGAGGIRDDLPGPYSIKHRLRRFVTGCRKNSCREAEMPFPAGAMPVLA